MKKNKEPVMLLNLNEFNGIYTILFVILVYVAPLIWAKVAFMVFAFIYCVIFIRNDNKQRNLN